MEKWGMVEGEGYMENGKYPILFFHFPFHVLVKIFYQLKDKEVR